MQNRALSLVTALALGVAILVCCTGNSAQENSAQAGQTLKPLSYDSPPAMYPLAVRVMTQNDGGLGAMALTDMAKLVAFMSASGAPSGSYVAAIKAGMKTVWYQDPHRIGDVPGGMSDRPPVTALSPSTDLMKCARGGLLHSTYSSRVGTYFGDPTAPNLIKQTNAQLADATAHYGPISYLWLDDAVPISELWAQAWYCGDSAPALQANNGNGMPTLGYGVLRDGAITYHDGTPFTPKNFITKLASFDAAIDAPVIDEGACLNADPPAQGEPHDGESTASLAQISKKTAGIMCENFAEGWGNRQTRNGKAVDVFWKRDIDTGIRTISAGKLFVNFQYIGDEGSANRGTQDDYDQRGYIYASYMLLFNEHLSVYKTGLWGDRLGVKAPVLVMPENLLVPLQPLTTPTWPQRADSLRTGAVYVREFAACGYAGKPIGPCAAVVNPSSTTEAAIPPLQQTYHHAVSFTGDDGAFTGRNGTPNYGDTGDLDFSSKGAPTSLPPAGWAILVR
jgi:hypothetical protein